MSASRLLNSLLVAALMLAATAHPGVALTELPAGETAWQGEVVVDATVRIPRGSRLVIRAGSTVRVTAPAAIIDVNGVLDVDGSADRPVIFQTPEKWLGISFLEAEKGSRIAGARFSKAETAISSIATDFEVSDSTFSECGTAVKLLRESSPMIRSNRFEDNDFGVDNEMKSSPTIRDNTFTGHRRTAILASHNSTGLIAGNRFEGNEQGIGLLQTYPDRIEENLFIGNKLALYCNQTKNTPLIRGNRFERNEMALVNYAFAYPAVEDNLFIENKTAVRNDQYGSPLLRHNLFRGNETAIYNYRKSNPMVVNNVIEKNRLVMFCDYSSYPKVENNNFADNDMAVELGIYQSADWEKRSGSKALMQKEALARKSKNTLLSQAPTRFSDIVDVSNNWWGEKTAILEKAEADTNLPFFHDRLDKEWVVYEGFGPESYRIDLVEYRPWLEKPVAPVGPRKVK